MQTRPFCVATAILLLLASAAGAVPPDREPAARPPRPAAAAGSESVPDSILYRFYFAHLENLDRVAAQQEAAGKEGLGWRTHEARAAGLTPEEGEVLRQVAADCNRLVRENRSRLQAALAPERSPKSAGKAVQDPQENILPLAADDERAVLERVDELRTRLGEAAFQKLDRYLRASFRPRITTRAVPAPGLHGRAQ